MTTRTYVGWCIAVDLPEEPEPIYWTPWIEFPCFPHLADTKERCWRDHIRDHPRLVQETRWQNPRPVRCTVVIEDEQEATP